MIQNLAIGYSGNCVGLVNFEPHEEELAIETYETWAKMFELQRYYSWIVDRFHISTQMYQLRRYGIRYEFKWLESRLLALGFRLVFCTRSPETFEAAKEERLKISGNPAQYDNLQAFIDEQALMRQLIDESILPSLTVDVSDNNVPAAVEKIADWLEETNGLYM